MVQFDNEASQTRDYCVAKNATHRAARPDPSLRKERLLRMTSKLHHYQLVAGLDMFDGVWQAGGMKKQASDQSFHDRRYQERKRAEAAKKAPAKKVSEAGKKESSGGAAPNS